MTIKDALIVQEPDPDTASIPVIAVPNANVASDSALTVAKPHAHTVSVPVPAVTMPEMTMVSQSTMDVTKYWFHQAVPKNSTITVNLP